MSKEHHVAFCPHCGNTAPQRIVFSHRYETEWYDERTLQPIDDEGLPCEAILCICETCNNVLLYSGVARGELDYEVRRGELQPHWPSLAYPNHTHFVSGVPEEVRDTYAEASLVKRNAPRAFALLVRRGLEAICDERNATGASLAARLKNLADRGDIPPVLAEMTDVLRLLGNIAAHGPLQAVTTPMTAAIDDFFCAVVEYVYVAPTKLAEFRDTLRRLQLVKDDDA